MSVYCKQSTKQINYMMKKLRLGGIICSLLFICFGLNAQVSVTATAGTIGPSPYTTLKGAFDAINAGTHQGAINIVLTANTNETATATLNASGGTAAYTSVNITASTPVVISGSIIGAIIKLNGADNVTLDGRIMGSGRNITVQNNSTSSSTAAIWLASVAAGNGVTNSTIRNLEILCGITQNTSTSSTFGIIMCGTTISTSTNGTDNDNNSFIENRIVKARYGIVTRGTTTNLNESPVVKNNIIGPTSFGADEIGKVGIFMQADNNALVEGNIVQFVGGDYNNTSGGSDRIGIAIGQESWGTSPSTLTSTNYTVRNNTIHDVAEERLFSAVGLLLGTTNGGSPTANKVYNNFIYNIKSNGTGGDMAIGLGISGGHTDVVANNSISMTGDVDPTPAAGGSNNYGSGIRIANANGSTHANLKLVNNSVYMDLSSSSTPTNRYYAISGNSASYSFGTGGEDYNNYYINPSNPQCVTGGLGSSSGNALSTQFATLANWKTAYTAAQDVNSIQANPMYVNNTSDLHIGSTSPNIETGVVVAEVTQDIDGDTRPQNGMFEIGADEIFVQMPDCTGTPSPGNTIASATSTCVGTSVFLSLQNATPGDGVTYQWFDDSGAIPDATNSSYTTYTLSANQSFYCEVTCTASGGVANSNPILISVVSNPVAGTISGPTSGIINTPIMFSETGSQGSLQWQTATSMGGTYSNVSGATSSSQNIQFSSTGTLFVRLKVSNQGCPDVFSNVVSIVISIVGDNVCDALTLNLGNNSSYTNVGATGQSGEVVPPLVTCVSQTAWCLGGNSVVNSVWFKYTPAVTGKYSFTLSGTTFDSQFALYSASSCSDFGSFNLIAANDDVSSVIFTSKINPVCLTGGTTYYLKVDGWGSATGSGWGVLIEKVANTAPVFSGCPTNMTLCGTNTTTWTVPSVSDDCGNINLSSNFNPGDEFPNGVNTITYLATDEEGATSVCSFVIKVSEPLYFTAEVTPAACAQLTASVYLSATGGYGALTYSPNNPPTTGLGGGFYTYYVTDANGCTASTSVEVVEATNPCTPPTAVCGNIITVYAYPGNLAYNGPGTADVYLIPAVALDGGTFSYSPGTLTRKVMRTLTNVAFNWTTNGACMDATPNGVYNNNDKGIVFRDCLPVTPADFNQIRNFDMTITDQFGTVTCSGRYKVVLGTPPGNNNADIVELEEALTRSLDGEFEVYPNPGTTQVFVNVNIEHEGSHTLSVFDAMGREVKRMDNLYHGVNVLDTEDLVPGMYTMVMKGGGTLNTIKWLKME